MLKERRRRQSERIVRRIQTLASKVKRDADEISPPEPLDCHNEDDPIDMESLSNLEPEQIFPIMVGGKKYCFNVQNLVVWARTSPTNPVTGEKMPFKQLVALLDAWAKRPNTKRLEEKLQEEIRLEEKLLKEKNQLESKLFDLDRLKTSFDRYEIMQDIAEAESRLIDNGDEILSHYNEIEELKGKMSQPANDNDNQEIRETLK